MMTEKPLDSIAEVMTGYPFRGRVESIPDGDLRVIQARDVVDGQLVDLDRLTRIRLPGRARPAEKFVQRDDVIVMIRSEKPYAVHLPFEMPPTVVQNSFNTLRIHRGIPLIPEFLAMILNQSLMRARLAELIKGSTIPYIRVEDLRSVMVPLPPIERQRCLVALESAQRRERQLHRELESARQEWLDAMILAN
ncbi:MAG: restriction endonuclease subunit S [Verrucomicrobiales bacterium]|nr:restriction endonuclease subunit S [Verrucomicrobiales bacterium]